MHQLAGHRFAQARQHVLEQGEALALVLVQRIALAVAAEADDLAQMLERDEMLAPQMVERLQQHRLLDLAHDLRAEIGGLLGGALVGGPDQALVDLLVGDAFLLRPVLDRQVEIEDGLHASCQGRRRPTARR